MPALNGLTSTKFPSSAVLMEVAACMKSHGLRAIVERAPRESIREADRLANGVTDGFDPQLEMKIDPEELAWDILPEALDAGREAERTYQLLKEKHALLDREKKQRRRDHQKILGIVGPW